VVEPGSARRRSPLVADYAAGDYGALGPEGPAIVFSERPGLSTVQVESDARSAAEVARRLQAALGLAPPEAFNTSLGDQDLRLIWVGSWRWYVVEPERRNLEAELTRQLAGTGAAVVDLSHSRSAVRMAGHEARYVLAKGSGVNVHPRRLHAGCAVQTALFHVDVLIDCVDDRPIFDLYMARGFALALWQSLRHAAAEYGYRVA